MLTIILQPYPLESTCSINDILFAYFFYYVLIIVHYHILPDTCFNEMCAVLLNYCNLAMLFYHTLSLPYNTFHYIRKVKM